MTTNPTTIDAAGWLFTGIVLTAFMAGMGAGRQGHVLSSQSR